MEHSGNIPIFNIPKTLFWEYSPEFHMELFPNILGIYIYTLMTVEVKFPVNTKKP